MSTAKHTLKRAGEKHCNQGTARARTPYTQSRARVPETIGLQEDSQNI